MAYFEIGQLIRVAFGTRGSQVARVEGFVRGSETKRLKVRAFNATRNGWGDTLRKVDVAGVEPYTGPGTAYLVQAALQRAAAAGVVLSRAWGTLLGRRASS